MKNIAAAAVLALSAIAAYASPLAVSFVETSGFGVSGSFSGTDTNHDGLLNLSELNAWSVFTPGVGAEHFDLASLNAFGDFDYGNNSWLPNALRRDQAAYDAYMTFDNFTYSFSTSEFNWHFVTTIGKAPNKVPEPGSLALMGISLAALGFILRKKRG